tara:strand:+ start:282 stop:518 length:237 start_codon:yes stop_codon:yes gene_type:complete
MFNNLEKHILELKNGDRYNDYCINDALSHLAVVKEALEARETDPERHFHDGVKHAKWVMKITPIMSVITDYIDGTGSW